MTENTDFTESRMLHAYLDGELDGAHEEALFRTLSENSALRAEMQDHLAIRKAIQFDSQAFSPPPAATAAIFGALGFSIPSAVNAAPAGGAGRFWFASGSAILAVATSLLLSTLFQGTSEVSLAGIDTQMRPVFVIRIDETPGLPDLALSSQASAAALPELEGAPQAGSTVAVSDQLIGSFEAIDEFSAIAPASFATRGEPDLRGVRAPFIAYVNLLPIVPDRIQFYARNSALQAQPVTAVESASTFPLTDMGFGALMPLTRRHSVGLEFGRETFPQRFSGTLRGASVEYEQNPIAYCATAVYQFNAGELLPLIWPYWQLQVGAAYNIGPLARATMGIAIKPFDRIAVLVGAEGSILAYKFQDRWFDTRKAGLTYGLQYEF